MDPVPIAIYAGLIPATILALLMLAGAWATRWRRMPDPRTAPPRDPANTPRTTDTSPDRDPSVVTGGVPARAIPSPAAFAVPTIAWLAGFLVAIALIHLTAFTSWHRPDVWPTDATHRLLHSAVILAAWTMIELALGVVVAGRRRSGESKTWPVRLLEVARRLGRAAAIATVLTLLARAFIHYHGLSTVITLVVSGTALTLIGAHAMSAARERHPALPWATQFLAALGAAGVLFIGRTSTHPQAAAGLAALAAATAVPLVITRRAAPGPVASFLWTSCLAWLLMVGCVATKETSAAACALILAAPWGWLLPRRLDLNLFWKRVPLSLIAAVAWAIICTGAAVALAAITQPPAPEAYEF